MSRNLKQDFGETLKSLSLSYSTEYVVELFNKDNIEEATKNIKQNRPDHYTKEQMNEITIEFYKSLKRFLVANEINHWKIKEYLTLLQSLSSIERITHNVSSRLKILSQYSNYKVSNTEKMITEICREKFQSNDPLELIKTINPDLFYNAKSSLIIPSVEKLLAIGVYRWRGDANASDYFSKILRMFKDGEEDIIDFMIFLAFHYLKNEKIITSKIDYLIPVPADDFRASVRGKDLAHSLALEISQRFIIPELKILSRNSGGKRSRDCSYRELKEQYSISKKYDLSNSVILLIDDIATKGKTLRICAELLEELKAEKIYAFCLARAESTKKSLEYDE